MAIERKHPLRGASTPRHAFAGRVVVWTTSQPSRFGLSHQVLVSEVSPPGLLQWEHLRNHSRAGCPIFRTFVKGGGNGRWESNGAP